MIPPTDGRGSALLVALLCLTAGVAGVTAQSADAATNDGHAMTVLTAPTTNVGTATAVRANATEAPDVAKGDALVLRIAAPGLAEAVAAESGENATARFDALLDGDRASLTARQREDTVTPERVPKTLTLTTPGAYHVVPGEGDTYYLVVNLTGADVAFDTDATPAADLDPGEAYVANFTFDGQSVTADFGVDERAFQVSDGDDAYVFPAANQTVRGTTSVAPGTRLVARMSADDVPAQRTVVTVDRNGTFAATFDFSDVGGTANATLILQSTGGTTLTETTVHVRPPNASVAGVTAARYEGYSEVTGAVTLSHGGFVVVYRDDGRVVRRSEYLPPGTSTLALEPTVAHDPGTSLEVVPFRDVNGNEEFDPDVDEPYPDANATLTVEDRRSNETTTTAPPTTTATTTERPSTDGPATSVVDDDIPGFGVAVALAALLGALALARRQ